MSQSKSVVVMITEGKSDNGKKASLAFSCALSAISLGMDTTVFLTSDGAVWGYQGSGEGIKAQGFPPLDELIREYQACDGNIMLCSTCHKTCGIGSPDNAPKNIILPGVEIAGFTTVLELADGGNCFTF
ncbi:MAG: DsrE family protein [Planctomycetales bacterium]|nr:DsrE family protein [Planctomycetales bacterium]